MAQYDESSGDILRNYVLPVRRSQGLSQADLVRLSGLSRPTIRVLERNGGYLPHSKVMVAVCVALGRRLEDLFWIDPDPRSDSATAAPAQ